MRAKSLMVCAAVAGAFGGTAFADGLVWGGWDSSRTNWPGGVFFDGSELSEFRAIIAAAGDTVVPGTSTLNASYLAGIDVFYTSLHKAGTPLSSAEQTALQDWIADGGILVLAADYLDPSLAEGYTAAYGVSGYFGARNTGNGSPVGSHPIMDGVSSFYYAANAAVTNVGPEAEVIGVDQVGNNFAVVLDGSTSFSKAGCVFVMCDFNILDNSRINEADNRIFAANILQWAGDCGGAPSPDLAFSGNCPGTGTFDGSNLTPGGRAALVYGFGDGPTTVPNTFPCGGTVLNVGNPNLDYQTVNADGSGNTRFQTFLPANVCGRVRVQLVDLTTCAVSNVVIPQ